MPTAKWTIYLKTLASLLLKFLWLLKILLRPVSDRFLVFEYEHESVRRYLICRRVLENNKLNGQSRRLAF